MEHVILVDSKDRQLGTMEKLEAHKKGVLHRAFSVILFNENGDMLLQKRAASKYHSPGLWSNTCCSHPRPDENMNQAVNRRLKEEMGLNADTTHLYNFIYRCGLENELTEHELDHVFIGETNTPPSINPAEVDDVKWISWQQLYADLAKNEDQYSFWFKQIVKHLYQRPFELPRNFRPKI